MDEFAECVDRWLAETRACGRVQRVTPQQYARVREVFVQALERAPADRVDFVRRSCGQETVLADEVLSLLSHHRDASLFAPEPDAPADAADARAEQERGSGSASSVAGASQAAPVMIDAREQVDPYLVLDDVWQENRQILRRRLTVIALVIAALVAISTLRLFTYQHLAWGYGVRVLALATSLGCALLLYRRPALTLRQIRLLELLVIANIGLLIIVIQVRLMLVTAAAGDEATLISVNNWHYFSWTLVIFIYGVFMLNTWQRAASIVLPIAAIPSVVVLLICWNNRQVALLLAEDKFGQPMPTPFVAAAISIYAAHLIHGARLAAHQAQRLAQYRITRKIGEGGMGQVFEAEHMLLKRACAVKLIRPELCADDRARQRFEREVRVTAQLTHPHTIEIYDYGQTKDEVFFFAMELLPGMSLGELVGNFGPLPPERVVYLLLQTCEALEEAHGKGLIHRDIKPANIFVSQRGGIFDFTKLLDFGLVREVKVDPHQSVSAKVIEGTPAFMSPEQITSPGNLDARCDIYSLGAVAYFLLTGGPPLAADSPIELMLAQVNCPPAPPSTIRPEIPPDLESIVMRCLAKLPNQRMATAAELQGALRKCECSGLWSPDHARTWWTAERSRPR